MPTPDSKRMDEERKFLEGLLKDRFNFFVVAAPIYLFGVFRAEIPPTQRTWALVAGFIIFAMFARAVARTNSLINKALDTLSEDKDHPYTILCEQAGERPRANNLLVAITVAFVLLILIFLITSLCGPDHQT